MSNHQFERLVSNLQSVMRCPHCSGSYQPSDIHYLGQMDSITFLHMRCPGCHSPIFASVAMTDEQGELRPSDVATNQINYSDSLATNIQKANPGFAQRQLDLDQAASGTKIPVQEVSAEAIMRCAFSPVVHDDVLDTHSYLSAFDGDFETVWGAA